MTTFEHAMLGVTAAVALGLPRHYGWPVAAMAGVAAISPDWDGLSLAWSATAFDRAHRAWGHNLLVAALLGAAWGALDYRYGISGRVGRRLEQLLRIPPAGAELPGTGRTGGGYAAWMLIGSLAALSHLATDLVVSGAATAGDWELKLLWPFSQRGWVWPMLRWGDPGPSVILFGGAFAMLRWPPHARALAWGTLLLVVLYIAAGGVVRLE